MHVAQLGLYLDPQQRMPESLLAAWPALSATAEAVVSAGTTVSVVQASARSGHLERAGVVYEFVAPERPARRVTRGSAMRRILERIEPDVLHIHGLRFVRETLDLVEMFPDIPLLLQDHAERLPRFWSRRLWRRAIKKASGFAFCSREQAEPFLEAGMIRPEARIFEIPEAPTAFTPGDRTAARAATAICGNPAILAVCNLNDRKDPLTVLDGVSAAVAELPQLRLWWCYASAPRLSAVKARIEHDERLRDRVHLLGHRTHAEIELMMRAADIFVLGSHREGGSFALMEALATGLTPVITDIPANRSMTGDGQVGTLWKRGDAGALARALIATVADPDHMSRCRVIEHFYENLTAAVIGRRFSEAYRQLANTESAAGQ